MTTKTFGEATTKYEYQPGCQIVSDAALAIEVASLLQLCFPTFLNGMSIEETLRDGIGFHDMDDTTWILLRGGEEKDDFLIGIATAIDYHNGIYVCNLCVSPAFQRRGFALNLLEAAAFLTLVGQKNKKMMVAPEGKSRLIGHADAQNAGLLEYYINLGAKEVQTGITSANSNGKVSRLRFERLIPNTRDEIIIFFQSIRNKRLKERQKRSWFSRVGWTLLGALGSSMIVAISLQTARRTRLKRK